MLTRVQFEPLLRLPFWHAHPPSRPFPPSFYQAQLQLLCACAQFQQVLAGCRVREDYAEQLVRLTRL